VVNVVTRVRLARRSADGGTWLGMDGRRRKSSMWKSIVLCASLFGGAALGLALGTRFVEPAALPAAAAIGLCVIGVVLILAAPTAEATIATEARMLTTPVEPATTVPEPIEVPAPVASRTPSMPFEAL